MMRCLLFCLVVLACSRVAEAESDSLSSEDLRYFERTIRPILVDRCYSCHSREAETVRGGLRLDTAESIQRGGDSGPVLVSGQPAESLLIHAISYDGDIQMPPDGRLPDKEIAELTAWIERGAPFPPSLGPLDPPVRETDFATGQQFWSFQPVREQQLPAIEASDRCQTRIDTFILAALDREGLQSAAPADRATLIRRLSFDFTGLPPSPAEVQAFVNDESPQAWEQLVERWLASPQYGEKWARMWLDLARYADETENWLSQEGTAHLYRDWVVKAFNDDMPYDEFVHRQLATDLMPDTDPADLAALGFVGLSPTYWKELKLPCEIIKVIVADEWEERVDAVSSTFLGLTVACARCHDHKFDPISSEDYYALAGVFASCRPVARPLVSAAEYQPVLDAKQEIVQLEAEIAKLTAEIAQQEKAQQEKAKQENELAQPAASTSPPTPQRPLGAEGIEQLQARIKKLQETPHFAAPLASALSEESLYVERAGSTPHDGTRIEYRSGPQDLPLFVRGDPNRPGKLVPRRFLTVLTPTPRPFEKGSGRLELAQAITSDAAPLAARVIVNRIWQVHFGQGLVDTPSNFGAQGSRPTHPELLDDLAARFIAHGWSIKWLHREILHSVTWQQSVQGSDQALAADPANRWLSRMNRRRLDFEAWRDAMLTASGMLNLMMGGPSAGVDESDNYRRTLYGNIHRRELSTTLQVHDFPDPNQHNGQRSYTTTALQGLYALNGPLLAHQAQAFRERLLREHSDDEEAQIRRAYWLIFSRPPTTSELALSRAFLGDVTGDERSARWQQYTHVLLAANEALFLD